jgi:hypothetical protein
MRRSATVFAALVLLAGCTRSQQRTDTTVTQLPAIRVAGAADTIPAGTDIEVRTNETISSSSGEGHTYAAQIETDIRGPNDELLIPKGSNVELVILETRNKSGIKGPSLQLGLPSVTVRGNTYLVVSKEVRQSAGLGANQRTAEMVGGGAALGTLIGTATGGAKGAIIGALAGAAAGAAVQVLTQGDEVKIPAETVLRFRLDEPIRLQPAYPPATP